MPKTTNRHHYFQAFSIAADTRFKISGRRWLQLILSRDSRALATLTVGSFDDKTVAVRRVHQNEKFVFVRSLDGISYVRIEGLPPNSFIPAREVTWAYVAFGILRNALSLRYLSTRLSIGARLMWQGEYSEIWRRLTRQANIKPGLSATNQLDRVAVKPRPSQAPIRAALFTHSLALEGAPISLFELTDALSKNSIIAPIVIAPSEGPLSQKFIDAGIDIIYHPFPLDRVLTASDYSNSVRDLAHTLASHGIELVLANTLRQFHAVSAARVAGIPNIWIVRETEPWRGYFDYLSADVEQEAVACFHLANRIIFVSEATRKNWAPLLTDDNIEVIPNSLDPTRFNTGNDPRLAMAFRQQHGIDSKDTVLLNVGRVCALKGQADIANALARLDDVLVERLRLVMVGDCDPTYRQKIESALKQDDLTDRVIWIGAIDAPVAAYQAADIYVCSSHSESYPRAILEAMSAGLAIIATPVGGITGQVTANESALFFDPGDETALAQCISKLMESQPARINLAQGALRAYDKLPTFDVMTSRYAGAIQRLFRSMPGPTNGN